MNTERQQPGPTTPLFRPVQPALDTNHGRLPEIERRPGGSPAVRPAFACGGPLLISSGAPSTLTEALQRTAETRGEKGITFVQTNGSAEFLSYRALWEGAKSILAGLQAFGLKPKDRIILQLENWPDHFTAFWAAVLGGMTPVTVAVAGSYAERNGMLDKLHNTWKLLDHPLVLTSADLLGPLSGLKRLLGMEELKAVAIEALNHFQPVDQIYPSRPDDLVFFQLTSGSTGIPKCIQETHRGIISHIHASQQFNGYTEEDISLNWLPVDHVVPILTFHLKDVYLGIEQIQVKTGVILAEPIKWLDLIEQHRVTHTWSPNFGFKLVSDQLARSREKRWDLSSVRFFMNAGEQVTVPVVRDFLEKAAPFGVEPRAMQPAFGMAEACTCMTYQNHFDFQTGVHSFLKSSLSGPLAQCGRDDPAAVSFVDLGPPVPGVQIRIVDASNQLLPEGVIGRFQIKGDVITAGYLNNEAANREAFVGEGWFNSGDLGFIWNGRLSLTGREKEMIIIRGANFYCYEIEDVVNQIDGVEPTFAAASAVEDSTSGTEGLIVFFVPRSAATPGNLELVRKIKTAVASSLGIHPLHVIPLEKAAFPKTTSGKIQRTQLKKAFQAGDFKAALRELQTPVRSRSAASWTERERQIAQIWKEVLGVPDLGREDQFFEMGDSLRAAQVIARLRDHFQVELSFRDLFGEASTIAGAAKLIESAQHEKPFRSLQIQRTERGSHFPASYSQQRAWLSDQMHGGSALYNIPTAIRLTGPLESPALEQSLNEVVRRHEILRTTYGIVRGSVVQMIAPSLWLDLNFVSLEDLPALERKGRAWDLAREEAQRPFDLARGPVIRARLLRLQEQEHLLVLTIHQIAVDGWSLGILIRELAGTYQALVTGRAPALPLLPVQYADFAAWQRQRFQELNLEEQFAYWARQLDGKLPTLQLNPSGNGTRTFQGATEFMIIAGSVLNGIKGLAREEGATLFMTLLAAFKTLLRWYSGQEDVVVGSAVGGRQHVETEGLIGYFVNTVLLRTQVGAGGSFRNLVQKLREVVVGAYANQDLPFDQLVARLQPGRDPKRERPIQAWFALNDSLPALQIGPLSFDPIKVIVPVTQFDLTLFTVEADGQLMADLEYSTDLWDRPAALKMLERFRLLLDRIAQQPDVSLSQLLQVLEETGPAFNRSSGRSPGRSRPAPNFKRKGVDL